MSDNGQIYSTSKANIVRDVNSLIGSSVFAIDGEAGMVRDLLFDDHSWTVRYLLIAVGSWIKRRDVAFALAAV